MLKFNKTILKSGTEKAREHDRVVITYSLQVDENPKTDEQSATFDLGHAEDFGVFKLLDKVVETMGLGEQCCVDMHSSTWPYDVEQALQLKSATDHQLAVSIRLDDVQKSNEVTRAYRAYKRGIRLLQGSVSVLDPIPQPEEEDIQSTRLEASTDARQLLVLCLTNAALCLLRLSRPLQKPTWSEELGESVCEPPSPAVRRLLHICIEYCCKAIDIDPDYAKAWFRLAKAHAELEDFTEAINAGDECLKRLKKAESNSLMCEVEELLQQWRRLESKINKGYQSTVRDKVFESYKDADNWSEDEDSEIDRLPVDIWSNKLAANMMSLHEELEAFGEKMPEPKLTRGRGTRRLETILDEDTDAADID